MKQRRLTESASLYLTRSESNLRTWGLGGVRTCGPAGPSCTVASARRPEAVDTHNRQRQQRHRARAGTRDEIGGSLQKVIRKVWRLDVAGSLLFPRFFPVFLVSGFWFLAPPQSSTVRLVPGVSRSTTICSNTILGCPKPSPPGRLNLLRSPHHLRGQPVPTSHLPRPAVRLETSNRGSEQV